MLMHTVKMLSELKQLSYPDDEHCATTWNASGGYTESGKRRGFALLISLPLHCKYNKVSWSVELSWVELSRIGQWGRGLIA